MAAVGQGGGRAGVDSPHMPPPTRLITAILLAAAVAGGCNREKYQGPRKPAASTPVPARATRVAASWRVCHVHDGDTLRVSNAQGRELKIRLFGIDAPEVSQAFGSRSRDFLVEMVMGQAVDLLVSGIDQDGRTVATVIADGESVCLELVRQGLAWHSTRYSSDPDLAAAESEARVARRGLWADAKPIAPWEWRKGESKRK